MFELVLHNVSEAYFDELCYDHGLDDIRSIIKDFCFFISDKSRFIVSGFGQERWPVSVDTDLPIFLEQLPDLLKSIESRKNFRLDFYEQGVERYLSFILLDDEYSISCISFTEWQPLPFSERINIDELEEMLLSVKLSFKDALELCASWLLKDKWVLDWLEF